MNNFKDQPKHKNFYVTNNKLPTDVRYQVRNGIVIIDIKGLVDEIMDEEGIGKYNTDKMSLNIPFNLEKQVTGNSITLTINKKRFLIRLDAMEILPSKQQKIDYDNTHPHRWKTPQWVKLIEDLFYQTYGFKSMELDLRGQTGNIKRGKVFGAIKNIKTKILSFKRFKFTEKEVLEYLRWAFTFKGKKTSLTLGLLQADPMIQEFVIYKQKNKTSTKERTWKK